MVDVTSTMQYLMECLEASEHNTISFNWDYNKAHLILFYSGPFCGQDIFYLHITLNDSVLYIPFYSVDSYEMPGKRIVQTWLPRDIYYALRGRLFNNSPDEMVEAVVEHFKLRPQYDISTVDERENAHRTANIRPDNDEEYIYLHTIRKTHMSDKMQDRIKKIYNNSKQIIDFLQRTDQTLVFTDDPNRARNLYALIAEREHE